MKHNVTVIIPCLNEEDYIEAVIHSVLNQEFTLGEFELIIVDGNSTDKTVEIVEGLITKDDRLRIINNPKRIAPAAMNLGIAAAKYELVLRLDAHAIAKEGFIQKSVELLISDDQVMCAGGQIDNVYENKVSEDIGAAMSSKFGVGDATFRVGGEKTYVDTLAFGVFRKKVFDEVGVYDESLDRNEDDDLSYRITKAGYKILFSPEVRSQYYVRASYPKLWNQYFQYGYWKVRVGKKHKAVTSIRQLIPFLFVTGLLLGAILAIVLPYFWMLYTAGIALYIAVSLWAANTASKDKSRVFQVALVFYILHLSYGWGYLKGVVDFLILQKGPSKKSKELTR
ncbi:MAG: glycosyltransferase family 2 protein [Crocinitomicaceae bacterium]